MPRRSMCVRKFPVTADQSFERVGSGSISIINKTKACPPPVRAASTKATRTVATWFCRGLSVPGSSGRRGHASTQTHRQPEGLLIFCDPTSHRTGGRLLANAVFLHLQGARVEERDRTRVRPLPHDAYAYQISFRPNWIERFAPVPSTGLGDAWSGVLQLHPKVDDAEGSLAPAPAGPLGL
jgi:hypothetical protein